MTRPRAKRTTEKTICNVCGKTVYVYQIDDIKYRSIHNTPLSRGAEEQILARIANRRRYPICPGSKEKI
jgi:hypothetical protein